MWSLKFGLRYEYTTSNLGTETVKNIVNKNTISLDSLHKENIAIKTATNVSIDIINKIKTSC